MLGTKTKNKIKKYEEMVSDGYMYRFFTPEEIDEIIKNRLVYADPHKRPKGTNKETWEWKDWEIEARRQVIIDYIRQGLSARRMKEEMMNRWPISKWTVDNWVKDAKECLVQGQKEFQDAAREVMVERIEGLLEECVDNKDLKSASKYTDQLNKINGLYTENINAKVDEEIKFRFGDEE